MGYAVSPAECDHHSMRTHQVAQAVELVRALRHELDEMTTQLAWVQRQDVTGRTAGHARCGWKPPPCAERYKRHSFSSIGYSAVI